MPEPIHAPHYGVDLMELTRRMLEESLQMWQRQYLIREFTGVGVVVIDARTEFPTEDYWFRLSFGSDPDKYLSNAQRKANSTLRTKLDTKELKHRLHLFLPGDFPWAGAIIREGIVVGVSGLSEREDHWLAVLIAEFIILKMQDAFTKWREGHPDERFVAPSESSPQPSAIGERLG